MVRRVAVIGAGVSGLASIKCCLDEGLEPTCFEKNDRIGGIWQFTETPEEGRITVYRSVITNTSKEMTCFSDFPFPADFPNYLRHSKLLDYLRMYAENFHLLDYIHFQTTVCSIRKQPDFTSTGQWLVVTEKHGEQASAVFDAIMVCSGHYAELNLPLDHFPGIENFKGRVLHSWKYRDQKPFEGKRVLVVGAGNTGGDIAVEISRTSAQLEKPTLAVIGAVSVNGSILPTVELQARWVTRVFNGSVKLPPVSKQISEIAERKKTLLKQGIPIEHDRLKTSFIAYMDEIAACIGVKPNIPLLFLLDTKLALEVIFGPCTSYQYRLTGPGKWKKARSAILTQWDRALKPLKTRVTDGSPKCSMVSCLVKILGLTAFLVAALLLFQYSSPSWLPRLW